MEKDYKTPLAIQDQIISKIRAFNKKELSWTPYIYYADVRGKFIYLMRRSPTDNFEKIGRLTYNGNLENMDFAIFRYSVERYDPSCDYFDGVELIDGTIEGAMKAGLEAYPIEESENQDKAFELFEQFIAAAKKAFLKQKEK